jgi:hypothetical protein
MDSTDPVRIQLERQKEIVVAEMAALSGGL